MKTKNNNGAIGRVILYYNQVRDEYLNMMKEVIELETGSTKCSPDMVWDTIGISSVNCQTINATCQMLENAPAGETVRYQIYKGLLDNLEIDQIEELVNDLCIWNLPRNVRKRARTVAFDLTYIPYHGSALNDANEVQRGKAKSGTTHFHVYASVCVIQKDQRLTIGVAFWQQGEPLEELLMRLMEHLEAQGIRIKRLLLDRQFASVEVIRYLDKCPWQSIMPIPARSTYLKDLKSCARQSHVLKYTMRSHESGAVTFDLYVVCQYAMGRRGKQGINRYLFAVIGKPWRGSLFDLARVYRRRFGIESSYRQMNMIRARTSSRDPKYRLLLVAVAFALINLWVTLRWRIIAVPRKGGRWLDPSIFTLRCFCNFLSEAIKNFRGVINHVERPFLHVF